MTISSKLQVILKVLSVIERTVEFIVNLLGKDEVQNT